MFEYYRNVEGNSNPVMMFIKATAVQVNQPKAGDAVAIVNGLAEKAKAASTAIVGIAKEGVGVNGDVLVIVDRHATYKVDYVGEVKSSVVQADMFTAFDLKDEKSIDLDATAVKQFVVVGFDNDAKKVIVQNNKPIL